VIAGRPGKFCAGFDLSVINEGPEAAAAMMDRGGELSLRLHEWPTPRVIASTGHALAMGAVLLACADLRIGAVGDFKYGLNEVAIGLALPRFAFELHRPRMATRELHQATVLSKIYGPESALEAGFLDELVEADGIVEHAVSRAAELVDHLDAEAFVRTRRIAYHELGDYLRGKFGTG
jgi:enoyl-CoA hydratase